MADISRLPPSVSSPPGTTAASPEPAAETAAEQQLKPLDLTLKPGWNQATPRTNAVDDSKKVALGQGVAGAFGAGVVLGLAVDLVASKATGQAPQQSLGTMAQNLRTWDADFSGYGLGTKTGAAHNAMHALPGAAAFLAGRNRGQDFWGASLMAFSTGVGIEVGEAAKVGHRPDAADAVRTGVYGTALGSALWAGNQAAERKYDETGNPVYKFLAAVTNPEHTLLGVGKDSQGKTSVTVGAHFQF